MDPNVRFKRFEEFFTAEEELLLPPCKNLSDEILAYCAWKEVQYESILPSSQKVWPPVPFKCVDAAEAFNAFGSDCNSHVSCQNTPMKKSATKYLMASKQEMPEEMPPGVFSFEAEALKDWLMGLNPKEDGLQRYNIILKDYLKSERLLEAPMHRLSDETVLKAHIYEFIEEGIERGMAGHVYCPACDDTHPLREVKSGYERFPTRGYVSLYCPEGHMVFSELRIQF